MSNYTAKDRQACHRAVDGSQIQSLTLDEDD
jgi:hypothetical protein